MLFCKNAAKTLNYSTDNFIIDTYLQAICRY
jgi:hypothetical protein